MQNARVLFIDIESSPNLAYVWEKYQQDVIEFEKEREIICFAYKWEGGRVRVFGRDTRKEKALIKKIHRLFDKADVIVAHNGDNFDIPMCNTAFVKHGLKPPSPYKTIDSLKIAKSKFKFNSNRLNDLGQYLGLGKKVETGGFKLWKGCLNGKKSAWKLMKDYNKQDVVLLEKVYNVLRGWAKTPIIREGMVCPVCGSARIHKRGWTVNRTHKSQQYQCYNCGKWLLSSKKIKHFKGEYVK